MTWRDGGVMCLLCLAAGCGGSFLDEDSSSSEEVTQAAYCPPTEAATQRVKTILPPSEIGLPRYAAGPNGFANFKGALHFAVNFEDGRRALWKSTGTDAGTTEVKVISSTPDRFMPAIVNLTPTPSQLFFLGADAVNGLELWVSEGTAASTRLVKDLTPGSAGSELTHLTAVGNTLVFFKQSIDPNTSRIRSELWKSDGTAAGTVRLLDFGAQAEVHYLDVKLRSALLFFVRETTGAFTLWRTDGTASGTSRVKRLATGTGWNPFDVRASGNSALFGTMENGGLRQLWKTDGTDAGTVRLAAFGPSRDIRVLGVLGSQAYVTATSYSTQYMVLYRVPLTGGEPMSFATLPNSYATVGEALPLIDGVSIAPGGTKLYFMVFISRDGPGPRDTQLWVTDGTGEGTKLLRRPLSLSDEYGSPLLAVEDDVVFFSSDEPTRGIEPWVSDGTPGGTRRLKDISTSSQALSSYPREYFRIGDRVYFSAYDDTQAGQLWSSGLRSGCLTSESAR